MKSRPIGPGQNILASQNNDKRDDARAGSFLLAHQMFGTLALGTAPANGDTVTVNVSGNAIVIKAVTGTPTNPNDVKAPGTPLGWATNVLNFLRRPDLTNANQVAATIANQQFLQYVGWAWPGSTTNIVPFSLDKNVNGNSNLVTSFSMSTTTSGNTWTANTMALYVEDGTYFIGNNRYFFLGGSTLTVTAPSSHPRIDVLTIDNAGTLAWTTGTENASPVAPAYPSGKIPLIELYNVVGETALYDTENQQSGEGYISNDVRSTLQAPAGTTAPFSITEGSQYTISPTTISSTQGPFTSNFSYTGSIQTWLCPAGVTSVTITLSGAGGGPGGNNSGGSKGGEIVGTYTVVPSTTYYIGVGQGGSAGGSATYGGGGAGGGDTAGGVAGGSGGGASWFASASAFSQGNIIMIAAGGGGAGGNSSGGGGGNGGGTSGVAGGTTGSSVGGGAGTASTGGSAGTGSGGSGMTGGAALSGGTGASNYAGGGGGGSGYYGGGGGGSTSITGAGGGGGSSWASGSVTSVTNTAGAGSNAGSNGIVSLVYDETQTVTPVLHGNDSIGTIVIPGFTSPLSNLSGQTITVTFSGTFPNTPFLALTAAAIAAGASITSWSTTEIVLSVSTGTTVQWLAIGYV
jgi:hypothetical protein